LRPRASNLKSLCPKEKTKVGIPVIKVVNRDLPEVTVYRGESGDYLVADDFCTCPSFLRNLDLGKLEPCKHVCAEKRVTKSTTLVLEDEDFDTLLISLLTHERSATLNLLLATYEGELGGEEEKEEEDRS